ncbi:MAG: MaoC family dehydratase N-terminal domain-containing protein [Caulobacteraceae bacterium]|nr:MaoC family dehydratase N-terminal domain-containing protein [Caulobacteraceae bacterium]
MIETALPPQVSQWLGKPVIVIEHVVTAEVGLWLNFCVAVQDANPLYWNYAAALGRTEAVIAPPAMLPSWGIPHDWSPGAEGPPLRTLELHFMVKDALGLPNGLVTEVEFELHDPIRAGDSVRVEQILKEVSPPRQTRLGHGRNWTIDVVYRKPGDILAGVQTLRFLGYRKAP